MSQMTLYLNITPTYHPLHVIIDLLWHQFPKQTIIKLTSAIELLDLL